MSLQHLWASVLLATTLGSAVPVAAQTGGTGAVSTGTGGIAVYVASVNGVANRETDGVYLGIAECTANVEVRFLLGSVPGGKTLIDVYRGEACNTANRNLTTGEGCVFITSVTVIQNQMMEVPVGAGLLFKDGCGAQSQTRPNLWFLPVNESQGNEAVTVYGRFQQLSADAERPLAPTEITAGGGESTISVHWKATDADLDKFLIYVDPDPKGAAPVVSSNTDADGGVGETVTGTENSECPSSVLLSGGSTPDATPEGIEVQTINSQTQSKTSLDPSKLGLGTDPSAIAVVAVDRAGNRSLFSEVVCAAAVPTEDFWEAFRNDGGGDVEGCPCNAVGSTQLQGGLPVVFAFLSMAVSARRRRTR